MLSFQLGGILIVPDRKLAEGIGGVTQRERKGGRERELVCMCLLSEAE